MNSNTNFIDFVSKTTDKLNSNNDIANEFRLNNLSKLKQIGLPTHRKGNEEWKYTNLNKFTSINYILPVVETEDSNLKSQELSPKEFEVINIINGKLSKKNNINNEKIKDSEIKPAVCRSFLFFNIFFIEYLDNKKVDVKLISITFFHSSSFILNERLSMFIPALLTKISRPPNSRLTLSMNSAILE